MELVAQARPWQSAVGVPRVCEILLHLLPVLRLVAARSSLARSGRQHDAPHAKSSLDEPHVLVQPHPRRLLKPVVDQLDHCAAGAHVQRVDAIAAVHRDKDVRLPHLGDHGVQRHSCEGVRLASQRPTAKEQAVARSHHLVQVEDESARVPCLVLAEESGNTYRAAYAECQFECRDLPLYRAAYAECQF